MKRHNWQSHAMLGLVLAAASMGPARAAPGLLLVQNPPELSQAVLESRMHTECHVGELIGGQVLQALSKGGQAAVRAVPAVTHVGPDERGVRLSVVNAFGHGGGSWSGPKSVTLKVELITADGVVATRNIQRDSSGGILGSVSGTCAIFERIAVALGKDVAKWVDRPPRAPAAPLTPAAVPASEAEGAN